MTESVHEWPTDDLDVVEYLARIGDPIRPDAPPTATALHSITEAHVGAIPFENVDVVLQAHPGLALGDIVEKMLRRRRGGYCYEHVLLLAAALEQLGFDVDRVISRVPVDRGPRTHATLLVRAPADPDPSVEYLVDVGFGAKMMAPMRLDDPSVVDQAGFPHRIESDVRDGIPGWTLSVRERDQWVPLHRFDRTLATPADYEVAHHYVSTHPKSPFTGQVVVMRLAPGLSTRLVGSVLTSEHADGRVQTDTVADDALIDVLRDLDVVLDADQAEALTHS